LEECGPCPIFACFTLAFALLLRKNQKEEEEEEKNKKNDF
jgi:hypothetical protein